MQAPKELRKVCQSMKVFVWQEKTDKMARRWFIMARRQLQIVRQPIAALIPGRFPVLYHFLGTSMHTSHTMDALLSPDRTTVCHTDISYRA